MAKQTPPQSKKEKTMQNVKARNKHGAGGHRKGRHQRHARGSNQWDVGMRARGELTYYGKQVNKTGLRPAHKAQPEATGPDHMQKPRPKFIPHAGNSVRQKAGEARKRTLPMLRKGQMFRKGTKSREAFRKSFSPWTWQRPEKKGTNASRFWKTESPAHARHTKR